MKQFKKLAALALSATLACTLLPVSSFADTTNAASISTETRTITWLSTEEQPEHAKTIMVAGTEYTLDSATEPKVIKEEYGTTQATKTQWQECAPEDLQATINSFAASVHVDENGFEGDIPQTGVTYETTQATRTWEVNANRTYTNLSSNDVTQIANEIAYTNPDTGNNLTLALAGISWDVATADADGFPASYTANCVYRGQDSDVVDDHYTVTATYAGEVTSKEPVLTYEATLTYEAPTPVATPTTEPTQQTQTNWIPVAIAAAVVAAGILGGFIYWNRRCDVRVGRMKGDTFRILAKTSSKRQADGSLRINLPSKIDPTQKGTALMLRKDKASGCDLTISQFGKPLCTLKATEFVLLN